MFGLGALMGTTALVLACGVGNDCDFGLCAGPTAGGDGGEESDATNDVDTPPGCKPELEPKDAAPCVVSSYGVFVDASNGNDANDGKKDAPVRTISAALAKIGNKPRIYVCEGTYPEHVVLTRGISIYGGFACGSWTYSGTKPKVAPSDPGFSIHVSSASSSIVLADLELIAQPGAKAAPSSIALFVARSSDVTLRRLGIEARAGLPGENGETAKPAPVATSTSGSINGNTGTNTLGGLENVCTCSTGGTTTGARGGDTGGVAPNGLSGTPAYAPPVGGTGAGQTRAACEAAGAAAQPGSDAPPGAEAAPPPLGMLDDKGWTEGSGEAGKNGTPGQGGGGGGSYTIGAPALNGGGGGGGCGGCGGGGGGGGRGGGSSVAVLVLESNLKLEASTLIAADAGKGGTGAPGETGGAGGAKGNAVGNACAGAGGGAGGTGGAGAGGSGGVSAGVLHKGAAPVLDAATTAAITLGKPGEKGVGGTPQVNDGKPGDSKKVLPL